MARYTIQEQAAVHKDMPPLAESDPNLVLDVDFTAGQAAVEAILETAEGLAKAGTPSGEDYDSVRGLNPNASFGWRIDGWTPSNLSSRADMYVNGGATIYVEVERSAIASTWKDSTTAFIDNADGPLVNDAADFTPGVNAFRWLYAAEDPNATPSPSPSMISFLQVTWSGSNPLAKFVSKMVDLAADQVAIRFSSKAPSQLGDTVRLTQVLDFDSRVVDFYIDDKFVNRTSWDKTTFGNVADKTDIFSRLSILTKYGVVQQFKGYVKQLQIINRPCRNLVPSGHKVGFYGDSIVVRSGGGYAGEAGITTEADVLAAQSALDNSYAREEASASANPLMGYHYNPWATMLSTLAASEGAPFQYYVAGDSGSDWSTEKGDQIAANRSDALITYNPEIIVCLGSVNDISANNATALLETDTKAKLDEFIDGCSNLRHILFLTTYPTVGDNNLLTAPLKSLLDEHVAMQNTLNGYRDKVIVYDLFAAMGGHSASGDYAEGSHINVAAWDAIAGTSKEGADVHPGQTGMSKIAELVWPSLKEMLYKRR